MGTRHAGGLVRRANPKAIRHRLRAKAPPHPPGGGCASASRSAGPTCLADSVPALPILLISADKLELNRSTDSPCHVTGRTVSAASERASERREHRPTIADPCPAHTCVSKSAGGLDDPPVTEAAQGGWTTPLHPPTQAGRQACPSLTALAPGHGHAPHVVGLPTDSAVSIPMHGIEHRPPAV